MVSLSRGIPIEEARTLAGESVASGEALRVFRRWMQAQGAKDLSFIERPDQLCPAKNEKTVFSFLQ